MSQPSSSRASIIGVQSAFESIGSFAVIGGIGFLIEAILITLLTRWDQVEAWQARIPSFLIAVTTTWLLNRRFTFAGRGPANRSVEAISYTAVQTCGAVINLVVFGLSLAHFPEFEALPVVPLALGAIAGFCFNFSASKMLIYRRLRS